MTVFRSVNLLFGIALITLFSACPMKTPALSYEGFRYMESYPSGSTINLLEDKFYIMGDDATDLMVLDFDLKEEKYIPLFPKSKEIRISKDSKADIEASLILDVNGIPSIVLFGSGSVSPHRDSAFVFNPTSTEIQRLNLESFYGDLRSKVNDLNIEAAALISNEILLGLRGNKSNPDNYIVVANSDISNLMLKRKIKLKLPVSTIGISGMDYDPENDILFVTFSSEDTTNSFDDGEIGESYLALIYKASIHIGDDEMAVNNLTKLSEISPDFKAQKIESVVFDNKKERLLLVADDDKGHTSIFTLKF